MADEKMKDTSEIYEIKIHGHLDAQWSEWFYGMAISHECDDATTLCGPLPDQTALYSVLDRIRDMNLQLKSVNQVISQAQVTDHEDDAGDQEQNIRSAENGVGELPDLGSRPTRA